jgi:two-component system sensor histidine kinase CpxA
MRSLFLRIFLWFWAAMVVVVAVLVVMSPLWTRSRPGVERWQRDAEQLLAARVSAVASSVERGPGGMPDEWQRPRHRGLPLRVVVLDDSGAASDGSPVERSVRDLAQRSLAAGEELAERSGPDHMLARPVIGPDGRTRVVVGTLRRPPRAVDLLDPRVLVPRLAVLTAVVGIFCLLLARHLSSPFRSLRGAARQLAAGDLSARVGPPVATRRDEIGSLARDFDAMAERLEQLVTSQRRLLRDVSHELRSPLGRLEVALELARRRGGEPAPELLDRIGRESGRLNELIGQLLSLERLRLDGAEPDRAPVDLRALIEEVAADARFEAEPRGCTVSVRGHASVTVVGSERVLRSAVENVLRNAVAHAPDGTAVEVSLATETTESDGPKAVIAVRDRGSGVPEDELVRLFEPFYRVSEARDRSTGGAGLGLAITERAVRWHGGAVGARNAQDGGLEITIRLPEG